MTTLSPALSLAAYLAEPLAASLPQAVEGESAAVKTLLAGNVPDIRAMLHRNRISLLPLLQAGSPQQRALLSTGQLAAYLAAEQQAYSHVRQEYAIVRAAFAQAGIRDVLIKSAGMAPSFPHLSDNVDDLVPADMIPTARSVLRDLGYVELRNLEEPHKFFFKRFHDGQQVAAHHLHEHIGWAVSFVDERLVLQRARPAPDDTGLLIPHPEDAFLITIAHALYENKSIKLGDVAKVRHCLRSGELDWEHMRELTQRKGWLDGFNVLVALLNRLDSLLYGAMLFPDSVVQRAEQALSNGHRNYIESLFSRPLSMPLTVSFAFSKQLFYAKCLHDQERSRSGKAYDIIRHTLNGTKLKLKVHSQPGMLITFSGVDGSGKTRHAQALRHAFERCDILAIYVWSRSGSSRFTDLLIRLGKMLLRRPLSKANTSQEQRASARREMLRNPVVRLAWTGLVTVDLLWQYLWRVRLPLLAGRVVICDRYVYDAIADVTAVTGRPDGLLMRMLTLLSPRPSAGAAFLLIVPPQENKARRPEDSLSESTLAAQSAIYAALAQEYHLTVINNSLPFSDVNDVLLHDVIQGYFARYHTVINALFMANPDRSSQ